MADYDDKNRGSIWRNEKKTTDKHPDFTGSLNVDGKDYWVSAWKRKEGSSDRAPALSFSVKPKDGKPMDATPSRAIPPHPGSPRDDMDDTIPF
jgi:hypothetical protein